MENSYADLLHIFGHSRVPFIHSSFDKVQSGKGPSGLARIQRAECGRTVYAGVFQVLESKQGGLGNSGHQFLAITGLNGQPAFNVNIVRGGFESIDEGYFSALGLTLNAVELERRPRSEYSR